MPDWKREITARVGDVEPAILEEIAQHLEARYEELQSFDAVLSEWSGDELRAQLARIKQRRAAPASLGAPESSFWQDTWQDLRYGLRQLRMNPGFAAVAILSLSLGIGANTAVFQLLDAVRLRALPVEKPQDLAIVRIATKGGRSGNFVSSFPQATYAMWEGFRKSQQVFSGVLAWSSEKVDLSTSGESRFVRGALSVSGDFFNILGVRPILGRVFTQSDDERDCTGSVVISHAFWQREYGGAAGIIGRKISLNGHSFEIIGVTPAGFYGLEVGRSYDLAVPLCTALFLSPEQRRLEKRDVWWLAMMGRLKPGISREQATAQLATISPGLFSAALSPTWQPEDAKNFLNFKMGAFPSSSGWSDLRRDYEDPLWMLLATAGLVLLIACANLANLMLARAAARERELAVRLALGASRGRLIRQLLAESLLLSLFGATLGALLARYASGFLVSFLSTDRNPVFVDLGTDWHMFAFLTGLAVLTCLLFGLVPAVRATRTSPATAMKTSGRGVAGNRERFGLRRLLVVSQVALSLVLLVGSLLFVRSLRNLLRLDAGFQQDGILVASYDAAKLKLPVPARFPFRQDILRRVRAIPGVESAAAVDIVPVSGSNWNSTVWMDGVPNAPKSNPNFNRVSNGYFRTLGTPMLAGRDFDDRDNASAPLRAVVTEAFAQKFTNGNNPVGRRFRVQREAGKPDWVCEIIGMVRDAKYSDLHDEIAPIIYFSMWQRLEPADDDQLLIRANLPLAALTSSVKQVFTETNPDITYSFKNFKTQILETLRRERLMAALSGLFGFLAVALAMAGLYGVISYTVARRTNEIGVRMALGADRKRILTMILREAAILLGIGLVAGSALALYAMKTADKLLFNLHPNDPASFAISAAALGMVAVAASYFPARRAARLDPMVALRDE